MHERPHEKLIVWKEAYRLCCWIHEVAKILSSHQTFGLVEQMCRSAYSVPLNIAEGNTKRTAKDRKRFLNIVAASLEELHCQMSLARDVRYIGQEQFEKTNKHINQVSYLLTRFRSAQKD